MQTRASFPIRSLQQYMRLARLAADGGWGFTQEGASRRIPVSIRSLQYYEIGQIVPGEDVVRGMARAYGTPELLDYYYEQEKEEAA